MCPAAVELLAACASVRKPALLLETPALSIITTVSRSSDNGNFKKEAQKQHTSPLSPLETQELLEAEGEGCPGSPRAESSCGPGSQVAGVGSELPSHHGCGSCSGGEGAPGIPGCALWLCGPCWAQSGLLPSSRKRQASLHPHHTTLCPHIHTQRLTSHYTKFSVKMASFFTSRTQMGTLDP